MIKRLYIAAILVLLMATPGMAQFNKWFKQIRESVTSGQSGRQTGLSDVKIGAGLKEALKVGTENTVQLTGRQDGYFRNEAIKILMPKQLRTVEQGLRLVGYGEQVDSFVLSMNRAAEQATPAAKNIFWNAIGEMTFDDARQLLNGGDTSATQYFQRKTTDKLMAAFEPTIARNMNQVGVVQQYNQLVGRYQNLPLANKVAFDVDDYVTTKTLDGLFHVLGQQEKKIRTNPTARVTDLLREVFAK